MQELLFYPENENCCMHTWRMKTVVSLHTNRKEVNEGTTTEI